MCKPHDTTESYLWRTVGRGLSKVASESSVAGGFTMDLVDLGGGVTTCTNTTTSDHTTTKPTFESCRQMCCRRGNTEKRNHSIAKWMNIVELSQKISGLTS